MQEQDFGLTTRDGLALAAHLWPAHGAQRGRVLLVHGMGEHHARYRHVAGALNHQGFTVMGFDHRGHGQSPGPRGDAPGLQALLGDVQLALEHLETLGGGPLFLYGHSMGGGLAVNYALRPQAKALAGVVATAPWLMLHPRQQRLLLAAGILAKIAPGLKMDNGIDAAGLSRDTQVVQAYRADALVHGKITPRMAWAMRNGGLYALAHAGDLQVPLLLMHGQDDPITLPAASERFYRAAPATLCEYAAWPHALHELHNEPAQAQVLARILAFFDAHMPGGAAQNGGQQA